MSTSDGSVKVIIIAFFANLGIATAKFVGYFFSGSASLLAEAIHSVADCSNQIFLLIGSKKSAKPADAKHPLGYGREAYFWSFIVAIMLFSLGGLFAIYEGTHKLNAGGKVENPLLGLSILLVSIVIESFSFLACLKEVKIHMQKMTFAEWLRNTKNSELLVIFTEDAAALLGLVVAAMCLGIAWLTGNVYWDALGSIIIGAMLVLVAIFLALEIKSFIIGEASTPEIENSLKEILPQFFAGGKVLRCITLQTGSNEVMLSYKIHPGDIKDLYGAIYKSNALERMMRTKHPNIRWQFVEFDDKD